MNKHIFKESFQEFIYIGHYSRWDDALNRRECWEESVKRYCDFMKEKYNSLISSKEYNDVYSAILNLEVMPSMRALWSAGKALSVDNIAGYNCSFVAIRKLKDFCDIMYILMNGAGVGFSVEKKYIENLPIISKEIIINKKEIIVFEDSKLGWAQGFEKVLNCLYGGVSFECDYSLIREKGERLKTFGGRASGPEPLVGLINFTTLLVNNNRGMTLRSIDVHDIVCKIAEIVVVGGIRRSACISLSDLSDMQMASAKNGDFHIKYPYRQFSNNSVAYDRKPDLISFLCEWENLYKSNSGERGFFNRLSSKSKSSENSRRDGEKIEGINPCLTGDTIIAVADGRNGVTIETLANEGGYFPVYSAKSINVSNQCGKSSKFSHWKKEIKKATAFQSGTKEVISVLLSDGSHFKCTPDHKLALKDGRWVEAQFCEGESLSKFYTF